MGTAGGVKLLQNMIKERFVVVSGDAVTDFDLSAAVSMHESRSAVASLLLHKAADPGEFGIVATDASGKITRFIEKPKSSEVFSNTVNTGIYILEPEALSSIPYHQPFDFSRGLFPLMLNNREPVYGFSMPGYWCDVGNLMQYRNVHFDALEGRLKLDVPATHIGDGIWIGERVTVHPSAQISVAGLPRRRSNSDARCSNRTQNGDRSGVGGRGVGHDIAQRDRLEVARRTRLPRDQQHNRQRLRNRRGRESSTSRPPSRTPIIACRRKRPPRPTNLPWRICTTPSGSPALAKNNNFSPLP